MKPWLGLSALVLVLLGVGVGIYQDYGVPWDEESQIQVAVVNHRYIFKHDPALLSYKDRYYGPFFELPLLWVTARLPRPEGTLVRHLLIYLVFTAGVAVFYLLALRLFKRTGWALLASAFLALSPRLFADAFYNSKDIPFMAAFIVVVWASLLLVDQAQAGSRPLVTAAVLALHAAASAALITTRVAGILAPALTLFLLLLAGSQSRQTMKRSLVLLGIDLALTAGLALLFWPILWHDPIGEFANALRLMSSFPFQMQVLYQGQFYAAAALPWHYLPVWFGITTPLVILALGILGLGTAAWRAPLVWDAWRKRRMLRQLRQPGPLEWLAVSAWLLAPVAAVYLLHGVLYDGWRHMFFVYPAWTLAAVGGLKAISTGLAKRLGQSRLLQVGLMVVVFAGLAEPLGFMLAWHPNENVYFNALAGDPATLRRRLELDYWGLAYKQAIDEILAKDPSNEIAIYLANPPGRQYIDNALKPEQSARLKKTTSLEEAKYFITDFRWHPQDYPYPVAWATITVRGVEIMAVYRLK